MKDSESQELKPIYIQEARHSADDKISLIDLVLVLRRRWKMMAVIIIIVSTLGAVYTLKQPKLYTFSTTLETGRMVIGGTIQPYPPAEELLAKLKHAYIPQQIQRMLKSSNSNNKIHKITPSIPKASNIIVVEVEGAADQSDLLLNALHDLSQRLVQDQKGYYEDIIQYITTSKEAAKAEIALLNTRKERQTEMIILVKNKIDIYDSQLANLKNIRVIAPPVKSLEPTSRSRILSIIASAFAGIVLAVFAAFFAEFVSKIKEQL